MNGLALWLPIVGLMVVAFALLMWWLNRTALSEPYGRRVEVDDEHY